MDTVNYVEHIKAFEALLEEVVVENISTEIYCRKYLSHLLLHKKYYLAIYADVLNKAALHSTKKEEETNLVDFGAGNGLLGIFAKFCGFKKVFLNDIDEKFVLAAQTLALQMGIHLDGYITGDIDAVQLFCSKDIPDVVVGTDVIEHIYNLEDFFSTLKKINPSIVSVCTTASNPANHFKCRQLKNLQWKDEHEGGTPDDFDLFGDKPLEPFLHIRRQIIAAEATDIDNANQLRLATATRGMNEADILKALANFRATRSMPLPPLHPTNTCNPLNSSWTERILSINEYKAVYDSSDMKFELYNGFYNEYKNGTGKYLNKLLNKAVMAFGIAFAPYIIFAGTKK